MQLEREGLMAQVVRRGSLKGRASIAQVIRRGSLKGRK
jgi:hypothetical protein